MVSQAQGGLSHRRHSLMVRGQRGHAFARMRERFGISLGEREFDELCRIAGDPKLRRVLYRQRDQREVQALPVRGRWVVCVYDPLTKTILTFLPDRAFKEFRFTPPNER